MALLDRLLGAFETTLGGFRSTATFFCFALVAASLAVIKKARDHPKESTSYEVFASALVCIFSVLPVLLLNALGKHERRPWLHRLVIGLFLLLSLIQVNLALRTNPERDAAGSWEMGNDFMVYCSMDRGRQLHAIQAVYGLVAAAYLLTLLFGVGYMRWGWSRFPWARAVAAHWRLLAASLCLISMWTFLGVFADLRAQMLRRAGPTNRDNEWTFGQAVAVMALGSHRHRVCVQGTM